MISPRSLRNVKGAPKESRPFVNLFKLDFPDNPPKRIRLPKDIPELLKLATEVLGLKRPAKQIFDSDDNPITDINLIEPKMNLYISCAAPVVDNFDDNVYKSRLPRHNNNTLKKLPTMKPPTPKARRDDAPQHQAIAASSYTVKENMRNAILSLYASLTPDHKAALPCSDEIEKLMRDTQQFLIEDSLLTQFIGPSTVISNTPLGQKTTQWMLEKFKGLTIDKCQFVITGPSQSGKSTLLSIATSLFYQKLQVSSETDNYLFCPINWLMQQICLEDFQKLFALIITTTVNMIRTTHMELIPIINTLHQWFLSLVSSNALLPLPAPVLHFPGFPCDIVSQIGRKLHECWVQKQLKAFLTETMNFPNNMARAFQYKGVVYVFDHFDASGYAIKPVDHFESSDEEPVSLSELICNAISDTPYFVASQSDPDFFQIFSLEDYRHLTTEHLITDQFEKELFVQQAQLVVDYKMCRGCPAYCAQFIRICEMAEAALKDAAVKSQYSRLRSRVDISRNELIQHEFVRFCMLLGAADTDGNFDEERMNSLLSQPEVTVKVR
ncbi:hypothetical protein TRFO_40355 [Tritrichomonas foetus]|uniref:Uncharacterized protein n=1 Tax=Tritrichomonas foetus TaxID=1144522 RepID=A0A1J4J5F1_9EUKA|nr:hypothetical protein TRFO_40355 [Tritrichomonas foetus]|eukprot:OHS93359.1 hypothetical protein TRFO_40355 [Tritrichomonas foetus]